MSNKKEELKATYLKDVEMSASKSKFGFFNVPPPVSAGDTVFQQKTVVKDENGRVQTQQRNIFSGLCATGVLKKSMFQYTPSYTKGDMYQDPGKVDRMRNLQTSEKFKDKQTFRPASFNKSCVTAAYEYLPQKQQRKDPKMMRSSDDGRVITENPNILSSPPSKIDYKNYKGYKYVGENYENAKMLKSQQILTDISKRGQAPFKLSANHKPYFSTLKQQFGDVPVAEKKAKQEKLNITEHDSKFKPSNHFNKSDFSYPQYMPIGKGKQEVKKIQKESAEKKEPFKLIKKNRDSRPCPSISLSKMNIMRSMR